MEVFINRVEGEKVVVPRQCTGHSVSETEVGNLLDGGLGREKGVLIEGFYVE